MSDTIDLSALRKLKEMIGGDAEDLAELVEDFLESLPEQLAEMRQAQSAQDWSALRIAVHSCKSNARDMGATDLAERCRVLELQCKEGAPSDLEAQLSGIVAASNQAVDALRTIEVAGV